MGIVVKRLLPELNLKRKEDEFSLIASALIKDLLKPFLHHVLSD